MLEAGSCRDLNEVIRILTSTLSKVEAFGGFRAQESHVLEFAVSESSP